MLLLIDRYDLYGSVAYPKQHAAEDVAELYRLAASRRGVFINPALTGPFGLIMLEPGATETEIRGAYHRLIKRLHPDSGGSAVLTAQITAARDRLLDDR